nr:ankyrin repeat-containing protein At5g02620-like [Ipomoea batatas]
MVKQLTGKRGDTQLHSAARGGNLGEARNGFDAFHVAAKQGDVEMMRVLLEAFPQLLVTFDQSNTTALHTAAAQGHIEAVNFLLETNSSLAAIPRNNGKTALHACFCKKRAR